eukprot:TRINITY_DN625_c0_g1_i4.p1 TRINITY_DN625_c0_g1~~TRINITY_DN625_c0_g1_i4.p1  ORF type:complete len:540 (+),score=115.75 TRINITY_DN625_c0_g1_i4:97-1620(+)
MTSRLVTSLCLAGVTESLKIGFVGDSGYGSDAANTYDIMRDRGVDLVLQNGDYDYRNDHSGWGDFLDTNWHDKGKKHVLMSAGNHDIERNFDNYRSQLLSRLSRELESNCKGRKGKDFKDDYGRWGNCVLDDVRIVLLGWSEMKDDLDEAVSFIKDSFTGTPEHWRICMWHRPEGTYNPGDRHTSDYDSFPAYEACREHGALTFSGHTHLYSRSKLMSSYSDFTVSPLDDSDRLRLTCGTSFALINGMAGKGPDDPGKYFGERHFRKSYTTDDGRDNGAVVCEFPDNGGVASCDFFVGDAPGDRFDSFEITSDCKEDDTPSPPSPPTGGGRQLTVRLTSDSDDCEEKVTNGDLSKSSSDLELTQESQQQLIGIRWSSVDLPAGATVTEAVIDFTCDEEGSGKPIVDIAFDRSDDSESWSSSSSKPSDRRLTSSATWSLSNSWTVGRVYSSPDLSDQMNEVLSRSGWRSGNAMSVVIKKASGSDDGARIAESRDGNGVGPVLRITYHK